MVHEAQFVTSGLFNNSIVSIEICNSLAYLHIFTGCTLENHLRTQWLDVTDSHHRPFHRHERACNIIHVSDMTNAHTYLR